MAEIPVTELMSSEYWTESGCKKNFWKELKDTERQGGGRKRKRPNYAENDTDEDEDDYLYTVQRKATPKRLNSLTDPPCIGDNVWVHYTDDCTCELPPLTCTCNQWYNGCVTSEIESTTPLESRQFIVLFFLDGEEEINWQIAGKNAWWARS